MNAKLIISFFVFLATSLTFNLLNAQVTVGSGVPPQKYSILEVVSSSTKPGGLRLPHLSEADKLTINTELLASPTEGKGLLIFNTTTEELEYWDGAKWVVAKMTEPWLVSGGTEAAELNTENIYQMGHVTVGSSANIESSAILNIVSENKGVLLPRITLAGPTDVVTIPNPTAGLLVYNTGGNAAFGISGYMYWSGTEWKIFDNSTAIAPVITDLLCSAATISPSQYKRDEPYTGVMKIPYTGGNGGRYTAGMGVISNGLRFILQDGKLENGSGELVFNVTGTPLDSSPEPTTINIDNTVVPFYNGSCVAKVGDQTMADVKTIAVMDYMRFVGPDENGVNGFVVSCTTPDGLYTLRAFLRHSIQTTAATATNNTFVVNAGDNNNVQIRNNSAVTKVLMWNYSTFYGGQITDAGGNLQVPANVWGGGIGNTWTSLTMTNFAPWGDAGIYNANSAGPEYRYYSWIDTSNTTKVAYIATIMSGIDPGASKTDPTKQKVFIKMEQMTAP